MFFRKLLCRLFGHTVRVRRFPGSLPLPVQILECHHCDWQKEIELYRQQDYKTPEDLKKAVTEYKA